MNIIELAQSLKAAAEKASGGDWVKESGDGWDATCSNDDQANSGFIIAHFVGPDAEVNREFVQAANPANIRALVEALEKAQHANAAQDDHINQQQDRIDTLEKRNAELGGQLSRYSMSPGQADQRACESRAARDALGFGKDADDVAPIDLRERIDGMKARIAELEREQEHLRPVGVMSEKAFHRLENSECRFIALWPRPGVFLPRKLPEDGVIVYARTAAAADKVEAG